MRQNTPAASNPATTAAPSRYTRPPHVPSGSRGHCIPAPRLMSGDESQPRTGLRVLNHGDEAHPAAVVRPNTHARLALPPSASHSVTITAGRNTFDADRVSE